VPRVRGEPGQAGALGSDRGAGGEGGGGRGDRREASDRFGAQDEEHHFPGAQAAE